MGKTHLELRPEMRGRALSCPKEAMFEGHNCGVCGSQKLGGVDLGREFWEKGMWVRRNTMSVEPFIYG